MAGVRQGGVVRPGGNALQLTAVLLAWSWCCLPTLQTCTAGCIWGRSQGRGIPLQHKQITCLGHYKGLKNLVAMDTEVMCTVAPSLHRGLEQAVQNCPHRTGSSTPPYSGPRIQRYTRSIQRYTIGIQEV